MLRSKRVWVGFLVTAVFLALLVRQVDLARMPALLLGTNYGLLAPALVAYFVAVWWRTARWQRLMASFSPLSARQLFRFVVIGYMANDLLPLRLGEVMRAYLIGERHRIDKAAVLGTVALERISDGLVLVALMAAVAVIAPIPSWVGGVLWGMAALFVVAFAMLTVVALARDTALRWLGGFIARLPGRVRPLAASVVHGGVEGLSALRSARRLSAVGFYTLLAWLTEAVVFYAVGLALGVDVPIAAHLLAMSAANLATTLPSSQAGIGPFEYFCAQALVVFGVDVSVATAYALLVHAVLILPVVLLGLGYLWREHLSLGQVVSRTEAFSVAPPSGEE